jgi:7-cyano-7-deazaguanine synthase
MSATANTTDALDAAVLISGGIDSTACARFLQSQGHRVRGIFVDYGQAALEQERSAVAALSAGLKMETEVIQLGAHTQFGSGELIGRNAFLLMAAIFLGRVHRGLLGIGVHAGTPYYDCSPAFIVRMSQLAQEHTSGELLVVAPFARWRKDQIYDYFQNAGLPIAATYSCESGTIPPCGSCASCRDRRALGC